MAIPRKTKTANKKSPAQKTDRGRKKPTREKILKAAIKVFSDYPYYSASIRMIGKTAKIEHPLISYYFPTKASLFEAVIEYITDEYYQANISWFKGLEELGPERGLLLYIDRFFDFAVKHPKALRIVALNLVQAGDREEIPGHERIREFFTNTKESFKNAIPLQESFRDIEMFTNSFNTLAINYLGAGPHYAKLLGFEPGSRQYFNWVKQTMMFVFLPQLKQIVGEKQHTR